MAEAAVVLPILVLLLAGLVTGGLMVYSYQQTANLAREGARWASVHGGQYAFENKTSAATAADVYNKAILPMAAGMDTTKLTYTVTWSNSGKWPVTVDPTSNPPGQAVAATVTVTVNYAWGGFTLTSTSVMPLMY